MRTHGLPLARAVWVLFILWLQGGHVHAQQGTEPEYFGQTPPGSTPEVFAPGIISKTGLRLHSAIAFSPDLRTVVWSVIPPAVLRTSFVDGAWSDPAPINLEGRAIQAPTFSADGTRLFYQAVMESGEGGLDLWWVEGMEDGWGAPRNVGWPVNTESLESQPSLTGDGTLYFTGSLEGVGLDRGIYRSRPAGDGYGPPELLGGGINSEFIDYCPWISEDESFLLFASGRPESGEQLHIHITFLQGDGSWSRPRNIHQAIGFEGEARFPSVSPDGRFLFFISGGLAYWVDMAPVMALKLDRTPGW